MNINLLWILNLPLIYTYFIIFYYQFFLQVEVKRPRLDNTLKVRTESDFRLHACKHTTLNDVYLISFVDIHIVLTLSHCITFYHRLWLYSYSVYIYISNLDDRWFLAITAVKRETGHCLTEVWQIAWDTADEEGTKRSAFGGCTCPMSSQSVFYNDP